MWLEEHGWPLGMVACMYDPLTNNRFFVPAVLLPFGRLVRW